jgi:hypothetical protein
MSETATIDHQMDKADRLIDAARDLLTGGNLVDLEGLDQRIQELCADIGKLPAEIHIGFKGRMISLIDNLNGLVELLSAQHPELSKEIKGVSKRQRAVTAYGSPPGGKTEPQSQ